MDGTLRVFDRTASALLQDALEGLCKPHKTLSPKWLYDQRGSELFEQITTLPEYYPTRTEARILRDHADLLSNLVPEGGALVEFGSGASVKTRTLLDAGAHFGAYVPIDISEDFLFATAADLRKRYPHMTIAPVVGDFTAPLSLPDTTAGMPKIGFFPGSTIGNLPPDLAVALLSNARSWPRTAGFILGVDLVKDIDVLEAAYDDAQGVTAKFISNILVRLNAEIGATFDLDRFAYRARWNTRLSRIDMELVSTCDQTVCLDGTRVSFAEGEAIHVSAARKFTEQSLEALVARAGWHVQTLLTDPDRQFAEAILVPVRD